MKTQAAIIIVSALILGVSTFATKADAQDAIQYTESNMELDEVQGHIVKLYRGRIDEMFDNIAKEEARGAVTQRLIDLPRCVALQTSFAADAPDEYWKRKFAIVATIYENHHMFHIFALERAGRIDNSQEMLRAYFEGGFMAVYNNDITPLIAQSRAEDPEALAGLEDLRKRCGFFAEDIGRLNTAAQAKVGPPEIHYLIDDLDSEDEDDQ